MAKPKTSASFSQSNVMTDAGPYPKSMEALIDENGHISLDYQDYSGYSYDDVKAFLATREYETHVIVSPDGSILSMDSQWNPEETRHSLRGDQAAIVRHAGRSATGDGYIDMHVHPKFDGPGVTLQIFSPKDMRAYEMQSSAGHRGNLPYPYTVPDTFRVESYAGNQFTLRYTGRSQMKGKFSTAYTKQLNKVTEHIQSSPSMRPVRQGGLTAMEREATARMSDWLKQNASRYGFEYDTNCTYGTWEG